MSTPLPSFEQAVEGFLARLRSGEPVDVRSFAALHPHLGAELLGALEALETLERARPQRSEPAPAWPERLGPYRLLREVGRGGMGVVFEAIEEPLGRRVALKLLPADLVSSASSTERFRREAVLASRLEHAGICAVYAAGVTEGQPWIAMRWVDGTTLSRSIAEARRSGARALALPGPASLDPQRAVAALIGRLAHALAYAHARGIVHRDVKPSNVMVTPEGAPVLLDFGLAVEASSDGPALTRTGETAGTPTYLAPELVSGERKRPDQACDVYSLGVTLYECLALAPPYAAPTRDAFYRAVLSGPPADLRHGHRDVPRDLAVITSTAMERDRERRYTGAEQLALDLEAFVAGRAIAARPVGAWGRTLRWVRREPQQAALSAALALAALALTMIGGALLASRGAVQAGRLAARAEATDAELVEGFAELGAKRAAAADAHFARALGLEPGQPEALVGRVLALLRLDRAGEARALLAAAPDSPAFARLRALVDGVPPALDEPEALTTAPAFELFVQGECLRVEAERRPLSEQPDWMRRALACFEAAVARAPQARNAYHQMWALTAQVAGDERSARTASAALAALWPDSGRSLYQAGFALLDLDPAAALPLLERAVRIDPTYAAGFQCVGIGHLRLGQYEAARAAFERATVLNPEDFYAHNGLGCAYKALGCLDEARGPLLRALALKPQRPEVWANLVDLEPDVEDQLRDLEQVLVLDPGQSSYRASYGTLLEAQGDYQGACDQLGRVVAEVRPTDPYLADYWATFARVSLEAGRPQVALDAAAEARSLGQVPPWLEALEQEAEELLEH